MKRGEGGGGGKKSITHHSLFSPTSSPSFTGKTNNTAKKRACCRRHRYTEKKMARTKMTYRASARRQEMREALMAAKGAALAKAKAAAEAKRAKRAAPKVGVGKTTGRRPRPKAHVQAPPAAAAAVAPVTEQGTALNAHSAFFKIWEALNAWDEFCSQASASERVEAKRLVYNGMREYPGFREESRSRFFSAYNMYTY
jgi:hypothetical protein